MSDELIAWLRGLRHRPKKNQINLADPTDKRLATRAESEGLGSVVRNRNSMESTSPDYLVLFVISPAGERLLAN